LKPKVPQTRHWTWSRETSIYIPFSQRISQGSILILFTSYFLGLLRDFPAARKGNPIYTLPYYLLKHYFSIIIPSSLKSFEMIWYFRLSYQNVPCITFLSRGFLMPRPFHILRDNEMGEICSIHEARGNCCNILDEKCNSKAQTTYAIDDNNKMDRRELGGEYGNKQSKSTKFWEDITNIFSELLFSFELVSWMDRQTDRQTDRDR
jgi:hypothetical protein